MELILPEGVGPHEERELDLMLAGEKPLAMFSELIGYPHGLPTEDFQPYIDSGRLLYRRCEYTSRKTGHTLRFHYYEQPQEGWRLDAIDALNAAREIGRLLGYTEKQIATFLDWQRVCRSAQPSAA